MHACTSACSGTRRSASDARGAALRARRAAAPRRRRAAHEAHADAEFALRRHGRPRDAPRADPRARRRARVERRSRGRSCASSATEDRFVLVTHENPDGDALGSLVGMQGLLRVARQGLGHVRRRATSSRCPYEYRFFDLDGLIIDAARTTSTRGRSSSWTAATSTATRSRTCARARPASSTSTTTTTTPASGRQPRRAGGIVHGGDRVGPHARPRRRSRRDAIAEALYVGLVTDTGRFMYENTGARAHEMAAELDRAAGVDVHEIYRRLYEGMPEPKLALLARALRRHGALRRRPADVRDARPRRLRADRGRGVLHRGHHRPPARRRGHEGRGAARAIPPLDGGAARAKVSLRATDGEVDVSAIARAGGGGGHRQAAGFTTELGPTSSSRSCARRSPRSSPRRPADPTGISSGSVDGVLLIDKPAGKTSHDIVAAVRRGARRSSASGTPARWTRSRPGCCSSSSAGATRIQRFLMALPKTLRDDRAAGRDSTTGDPEGEITVPAAMPPDPLRPADRRLLPAAARLLARSRSTASAPTRARGAARTSRSPSARSRARASSSSGARATARRSRSSARRGPTCARSSPTSATPTARSCGARRSARSTSADADPGRRRRRSPRRWRFLPRCAWTSDDARAAATAGRRRDARAGAGPDVLLLDAGGPVADRRAAATAR